MFERFTDKARRAVVLAQEEARMLNHSDIGPEHLLLALTRDDGAAGKALSDAGVTTGFAVSALIGITGEGEHAHKGHLPFTPAARNVMDQALREMLSLGQGHVGTDHLLLALLSASAPEDTSLKVLAALHTGPDDLRRRVLSAMSGDPAGPFEYEVLAVKDSPTTTIVTLHLDAGAALAAAGEDGTVTATRFTLGRGECFSLRAPLVLRDDLRYLDYTDARAAADKHGAKVCILTPVSHDVTALAADGTEVVIGTGTSWTPVDIEDRLILLGSAQ